MEKKGIPVLFHKFLASAIILSQTLAPHLPINGLLLSVTEEPIHLFSILTQSLLSLLFYNVPSFHIRFRLLASVFEVIWFCPVANPVLIFFSLSHFFTFSVSFQSALQLVHVIFSCVTNYLKFRWIGILSSFSRKLLFTDGDIRNVSIY